jgi:hypothetical protein
VTTATTSRRDEPDLSLVVTQLMKGVVYRDVHELQWSHLLRLQPQVRDYLGVIGLTVVVDEAEGYSVHRVIDGATHDSLIADEEDAAATTQAILDVVSSVRSAGPLAR